jgi:hypothetical protein
MAGQRMDVGDNFAWRSQVHDLMAKLFAAKHSRPTVLALFNIGTHRIRCDDFSQGQFRLRIASAANVRLLLGALRL